jgi:hypothetical protein
MYADVGLSSIVSMLCKYCCVSTLDVNQSWVNFGPVGREETYIRYQSSPTRPEQLWEEIQ